MTRTLTPEEAAERLQRSPNWVVTQARRGVIPGRKVGRVWRFTETDLNTYLERVANRDPWARSPISQARRRRSA